MTNKSIKFLAASAIALTSIGATSVLTSPEAFASSVTQKSGDENKGVITAVTNPFKTFEDAERVLENTLKPMLNGVASYQGEILPVDPTNPNKGHDITINISYGGDQKKADAEALANKVVSAADTAIAGAQPAAEKPAAEKPAEKPADKPAEAPAAEKPAEKPAETPSVEKPADKPADKKDDATKPADKKDDAKVADTKKVDAAQAQKVAGKETLPKTAATSGSVANTLVGVVAVAAAAFFGLKRKIFN